MKKILFVLAISITLLIVGCGTKQQAYNGYATYGQGGAPVPQGGQPAPIAGGCGVVAPADVPEPIGLAEASSAL